MFWCSLLHFFTMVTTSCIWPNLARFSAHILAYINLYCNFNCHDLYLQYTKFWACFIFYFYLVGPLGMKWTLNEILPKKYENLQLCRYDILRKRWYIIQLDLEMIVSGVRKQRISIALPSLLVYGLSTTCRITQFRSFSFWWKDDPPLPPLKYSIVEPGSLFFFIPTYIN